MEEEYKVHDDSQTEAVIHKPIAEHKGNCPLQTNSTKQGRLSFLKQNLKILMQSYALWLKGSVPINPKSTAGGVFRPPPHEVFWLITSKVESFSARNFVTFPNIKCRIGKK